MQRRVLYVVNPVAGAGQGRSRWSGFQDRFRGRIPVGSGVFTQRPGDAVGLSQDAAAHYDLIVAVGGDGTIREVAEGVLGVGLGDRVELAVVPIGTGNDFARSLGVSSLETACQALETAQACRKDILRVTCTTAGGEVVRHALSFAAVGIIGELLKRTTPRVKRCFGHRLSYPWALIQALWAYRAREMTVSCADRRWAGRFLFAGVSNTETAGGGMKLAPGAQTDDGRLNVNLIEDLGRFQAMFQIGRLYSGTHTSHPSVRYFSASELSVESRPPMEVAVDGDLIGASPAHFQLVSRALAFLSVPPVASEW